MCIKTRTLTLFTALAALLLLAATLTTCDSPMGFGDVIDWEAPVLFFNPQPPSPSYVRDGAILEGVVTDNIGVDRVIARNANTGLEMELFQVTVSGDKWKIVMEFKDEDNKKQIPLEIVAYDKAGNSGENSFASIMIIVDKGPPIVDDIWIQRTEIRTADLESYSTLAALETSDPVREVSANANKYQNGFFTIMGKVSEEETSVDIVSLQIYDYLKDMNTVLLELPLTSGSVFSPSWLISEAELLQAGEEKWEGYTAAYENGARYYYRVVIVAEDKVPNISDDATNIIKQEEGYFVMWEKADEPKGIIDPPVSAGRGVTKTNPINIQKGGSLPVVFFDDDQLKWAYTGLLTIEQWDGAKEIASGTTIPTGNDAVKLAWLRDRFAANGNVYNWRYDRYSASLTEDQTKNKINDQINGRTLEEHIANVQTGNGSNDNGEYILFSLVADEKLKPHTKTGPKDTNRSREQYRLYYINVIDENEPLIVFDTTSYGSDADEKIEAAKTGGTPEENTFPKLIGGERFNINGYTMRANKEGQSNKVVKFRMAWIPTGLGDSYISHVQEALQASGYPNSKYERPNGSQSDYSMNDLHSLGIQHWNFEPTDTPEPDGTYREGSLLTGTPIEFDGAADIVYEKQVFKHEFNILTDFKYNDVLENTTKLFVFYAEDDMGHAVFRQLRLLGNHNPPEIFVYDITLRVPDNDSQLAGYPNVGASPYFGDAENAAYIAALKTYNQQGNVVYNRLKNSTVSPALTNDDIAIPFQLYTRDTILKYWVTAKGVGDIDIANITIKDITVRGKGEPGVGSEYNSDDVAITYAEFFPDEAQKVFLFTATDTLGNEAPVQRTVAITNTARLESITTTSGTGTYGIGKQITLQANFSGQIEIVGQPQLNIRYQLNGDPATLLSGRTYTQVGNYIYESIPCQTFTGSALSLQFNFIVPEGAFGQLITMYDDNGLNALSTDVTDRPIRLPTGVKINDPIYSREAFVPGYRTGSTSMPKWITDKGSLQSSKTITLDGARPSINSVSVSGKNPNPNSGTDYYFKTGETINLTLTTNTQGKTIRPTSTPPRLQYYIQENPLGSPQGTKQGPYNTAFTYRRSEGSTALVFSLDVNTANTPHDGELVDVTLYTGAGTIEDTVENPVVTADVNTRLYSSVGPDGANRIYIKKSIPAAPASTLNNISFAAAATDYNSVPTLAIPNSTATLAAWEDTKQYSLNGGLLWTAYNAAIQIGAGTHQLSTRYIDRAGNEGVVSGKTVTIDVDFPKLIAVTALNANGYYRSGTLNFNLEFDKPVKVTTPANVTITLRNRNTSDNSAAYRYVTLTTSSATGTTGTTVSFSWTLPAVGTNVSTVKEMLNGLYISALEFGGLTDSFNVAGGASTAGTFSGDTGGDIVITNYSGASATYSTNFNLNAAGIKVDTKTPEISTTTPVNAAGLGNNKTTSVSSDNKTITLTFNEPVQRGRGTITIRPHGDFAIPAVIEDVGYYLAYTYSGTTQTETRYTSPGTDRIYISSMSDIYNNMTGYTEAATDRLSLIRASGANTNYTLASPQLSDNTGLSAGPYKKMTHGLKTGAGYTGNYSGTAPINTAPSPTQANSMIPDTATKWVLDYQYNIHSTTAPVSTIRAALTRVGFRRQDIAVTSTSNVTINGNTVTITLSEPLLPGLQWDLFYPVGTFTDIAGNSAAAIADTTHWFWSRGVQKPVIRIDRKSYDARGTTPPIYDPAQSDTRQTPPTNDTNAINGSVTSYNTVAYRIESETPGARIYYGTREGAANTGSATGAWTGNAGGTIPWGGPKNQNGTTGQWVQTNLIFRNSNTGNFTVSENGVSVTHNIRGAASTTGGTFAANYYGFRSFNRDALENELNGTATTNPVTLGNNAANNYTGSFTYTALQARKNYVAADARVDHVNATYTTATYTSQRGYEGVFRTVIALNQNGLTTANPNPAPYILLLGTNVKSGMPTIAGFPVRDGVANGDTRYLKMFNRDQKHFYWVSTEIVTSWYMQTRGNGSAYSTVSGTNPGGSGYGNSGDSTDWITAGYGDLSYGFDVTSN